MGIGFLIKKAVSPLLFPLPVCLGLLVVGLGLLWFTARQRAGRLLVTAGALLLTAFSYGPSAALLLRPLEQRHLPLAVHAPLDETAPRWIVVLGGGYDPDDRLPVTSQIAPSSLARVVEGVRLYKQRPGMKLVISGGRGFGTGPEAEPIADVARLLGVPSADLVLEDQSLDTEGQARLVEAIVHDNEFLLVTSASHMPRAAGLFRKRGMHPVPAPADYDLKGVGGFAFSQLYPQAENLKRAEKAVYEYLGLAWAWIRGAA